MTEPICQRHLPSVSFLFKGVCKAGIVKVYFVYLIYIFFYHGNIIFIINKIC